MDYHFVLPIDGVAPPTLFSARKGGNKFHPCMCFLVYVLDGADRGDLAVDKSDHVNRESDVDADLEVSRLHRLDLDLERRLGVEANGKRLVSVACHEPYSVARENGSGRRVL